MAARRLTLRELNRATLARQGLLDPFATAPVPALVSRVGSLQAQHPDWPPLALASRIDAGAASPDLVTARRERQIVRASLMRITVHVVATADYWPMAAVTLPLRANQWRAVFHLDPVTSPLGRRIAAAHPAVLEEMRGGPLAIHEIETILRSRLEGLEVPGNRCLWRHFSASVPLIHVPYEGETYGRSRYLPATQWLDEPSPGDVEPDAALGRVIVRYLAAFGPASVDDVAAYIGRGRNRGAVRDAIEALGSRLVRLADEAGRSLVDLDDAPRPSPAAPAPPRLLARWDSLLLAYGTRDRVRILPEAHRSTVITRNADVLPTFLVDGMVAGTWLPRRDRTGRPSAELRPFGRLAKGDRAALEAQAERLLPGLASGAFARYPGTD